MNALFIAALGITGTGALYGLIKMYCMAKENKELERNPFNK